LLLAPKLTFVFCFLGEAVVGLGLFGPGMEVCDERTRRKVDERRGGMKEDN
jgi:hypothetical protein